MKSYKVQLSDGFFAVFECDAFELLSCGTLSFYAGGACVGMVACGTWVCCQEMTNV